MFHMLEPNGLRETAVPNPLLRIIRHYLFTSTRDVKGIHMLYEMKIRNKENLRAA